MKGLKFCAIAIAAAFGVMSAQAEDIRLILNASSGPIVPGEWNTDLNAGIAYAQEHNTPLLFLWGNTGCAFCQTLAKDCTNADFVEWQQNRKLVLIVNEGDQTTKAWVKQPRTDLTAYPFCRIWWPKKDGSVSTYNWTGRNSLMPYYKPLDFDSQQQQLIKSVEMYITGWEPTPPVSFGEFANPDTEYDRLEAEAGTKSVDVRLVRPEGTTMATNAVVEARKPDGKTVFKSYPIAWAEGESNRVVTVDLTGAGFAKAGDQVTLVVKDLEGKVVATTHITYVTGNSVSNPDFAGFAGYGQWTMDFEAATNHIAANGGYTLVTVQGSQWCPDCANTERNFLDLADMSGANRFKAWATANSIALISMDIPNFTGPNATDYKTATLLSRTAYVQTLARAKEYPQSGADEELTKPALRSGLGYLTRKGVSDAEAAERLRKSQILVTANTDKGGFHRPEDSNKNRTGVPIFVLLRRDGSVAGRLTRFASVSPMAADRENFDAYVRRLEEMIGNAKDATEIDNDDARTTALKLDAFGGNAESTVSHADTMDTYELTGVQNGVLIHISAKGGAGAESDSAPVQLILQRRESATSEDTPVNEALVSGNLRDGLDLETRLEKKGVYYVQIKSDIASAEFHATNTESTVRSYALSSLAVLTPVQSEAVKVSLGEAAMGMRVVSNVVYRLVGFADPAAGGAFVKVDGADGNLWRAQVTDDVPLKASDPAGTVYYQEWVPGTVGFSFEKFAKSVKESVGEVKIPFRRMGGVSGAVTVTVSHDTEDPRAILYDSDGEKRYEDMDPMVVTWKDGESGETNVCFRLKDDTRHDGNGRFVFKFTANSGSAEIDHAEFVLDVEEDDPQSAGLVAFTSAKPSFASANTVYVKAGEPAVIYVDRVRASDGPVAVSVTATTGELDVMRLEWGNHRADQQAVELSGLEAGEVAYVTLAKPEGGLAVDVDRQKVRVVALPENGPEFASDEVEVYVPVRYVDFETEIDVVFGGEGSELDFVKLSGTLPAGLSVYADEEAGQMVISGVPSKDGEYEVVYQAVETVDGVVIPGGTKHVKFVIVDMSKPIEEGEKPLNPSIAETRVFNDVMVMDPTKKQLAGVLQLTIPPTGKVSAKYTCASGTVAFASSCWTVPPEAPSWTMSTLLEPVRKGFEGYVLGVYAETGGVVRVSVNDPAYEEALETSVSGAGWSKMHTAERWAGTYTVSMPVVEILDDPAGVAPAGAGYLVLRCLDGGAKTSGRMIWSGSLPNGTSISGSSVMTEGDGVADLPVCLASVRDRFSAVLRVRADAAKLRTTMRRVIYTPTDFCLPYWSHKELPPAEGYAYASELRTYGGLYDYVNDSLGACCQEAYETTGMAILSEDAGIRWVAVDVTDNAMSIPRTAENPNGVVLSFSRTTGVVSGMFRMAHPGTGASVLARWQGVVLTGWGSGCHCEESEDSELTPDQPFVNGAWFFTERERFGGLVDGEWAERVFSLIHAGSMRIDVRPSKND